MIDAQIYARTDINYMGTTEGVPVPTTIYDARTAEGLSWQENGFELRELVSTVEDWQDKGQLNEVYVGDIEAFARQLSGCDHVLFFPPIVRSPATVRQSEDYAPIQIAHSDYTEGYDAMIRSASHPYRNLLAASQASGGITDEQVARCRRILTLQFWRNIGPQRMDYPLAFCDANTVTRDQLVPVLVEEYGGEPTQFESFLLTAGEHVGAHQWFTYPALTETEVVVFRAFDSDRAAPNLPFWTPHCAFADPTIKDAPPRESVEMRAVCLFS